MAFLSLMCEKSSFYFLAFLIIGTLALLQKHYSKKQEGLEKAQQFMILFSYCLSDLLSGILVIITKKLMKSTSEEIKENKTGSSRKIYNNKNDTNKKRKKYLLLFGICLIDFLGRATALIYYLFGNIDTYEEEKNTWLFPIDVISRIIFSKIILKTKIYKHHYISLILIIIGFIPMFFIGILNLNKWILIIFYVLRRLAFCIGDILTKRLFEKELILPQNLMLYKGIFALIIHCFIFFPIIFLTHLIPFAKGSKFFIDDNWTEKNMKILLILLLFIRNIVILQIIFIFSPIHIGFLDIIIKYLNYIVFVIFVGWNDGNYKKNILPGPEIISLIIYLVLYIFIIFGTLVFTETIIINKCGLNEQTMPGLLEKLELDNVSLDSEHYVYDGEEEIEMLEQLNENQQVNKT